MTTFKRFPILVSSVAALAMATALALELPSFEELDADGDGYISRSEAAALPCLSSNYDRAGRNDERGLNPGEYRQALDQFCR